MSAQDLLHNSKQNKYKNEFSLLVSNLYSTLNRAWPHFLYYDELKTQDW